jgi:hypothetical protein
MQYRLFLSDSNQTELKEDFGIFLNKFVYFYINFIEIFNVLFLLSKYGKRKSWHLVGKIKILKIKITIS